MELDLLDIALRGAATGVSLALAALLWTSRVARDAQAAFTLLSIASVARMWSTLPTTVGMSDQVLSILRVVGVSGSFAMTWFVLTIFLDNKRFTLGWLASSALISTSILVTPKMPDMIPYLRAYAGLHFMCLLGMVLYSGLGDLQDARRRMRPFISSFLLVYCVGLAVTSTPMQDSRPVMAALFQSGAFLFFVTIFALWALKANLNNWPGETTPISLNEPTVAQNTSLQNSLVTRIQHAMDAGVWQVEGLTVSALAQRVNAPEHQVRKAINQVLGHRNFASFINRARIDAAKARLQTPEATDVTILEVAYDAGFSSLGPFNRAFRDATGLSPTDFRKQAMGLGDQGQA